MKENNEKKNCSKWIVVLASGYCFGILIGMSNNYSLIYVELDRVFNETSNRVLYASWIGSTSVGVELVFCVIGSVLVDIYNPLKVGLIGSIISTLSLISSIFVTEIKLYFLTYGFFYGAGQAFLLASTLSILPYYFDHKLPFVTGIMNFIGSIIVVILPLISSLIIEKFSLKFTFLFLAILNSITILCVLCYRTQKKKETKKNFLDQIKQSFGTEIFKNKKFIIWCLATFIAKFGYFIPIINIDHHSKLVFPEQKPVVLNVIFSICAGISGIIFGKIGQLTSKLIERLHFHTMVYLLFGIVQFTIPFARNFGFLMLQVGLLGFFDGISLSFLVPISVDLAGSTRLANQAAAYYHISMSLTAIMGPTIAGRIFEIYKSYDIAFYIGGLSCITAGFVLIIGTIVISIFKKESIIESSEIHGKYFPKNDI